MANAFEEAGSTNPLTMSPSTDSGARRHSSSALLMKGGANDPLRRTLADLVRLALAEAAKQRDPRRRSDLHAMLGILFWDVLDDHESALRHFADAGMSHPVAPRLRVGLAISLANTAALAALEEDIIQASAELGQVNTFLIARDLAEAWLWRFGDGPRALRSVRRVLALAPMDLASRELASIAMALSGDWSDLAEHLLQPDASKNNLVAGDIELSSLIEAAHVISDRLLRPSLALDPLTRARGAEFRHPVALERFIEYAEQGLPDAPDLKDLYRRKLALLENEPRAARERAVVTFQLAEHLERVRSSDEARSLYVLLSIGDGQTATFGPRLALMARRRMSLHGEAWDDAAATYKELARGVGHPAFARAYLHRAAEIADAFSGDTQMATELYAELWSQDSSDSCIARALARLLISSGKSRELLALLEGQALGRPELELATRRAAAAVAETRLGDLNTAFRHRRATMVGDGDVATLEDLARLVRKTRDSAKLAELGLALARLADDDRVAAFWNVAAGLQCLAPRVQALDPNIAAEIAQDAAVAFGAAIQRDPHCLLAHAGLAAQRRLSGRHADLASSLRELRHLIHDDAERAALERELGRIQAKLGDPDSARTHLERALSLRPDDPGLLIALADLASDSGDWQRDISLRERAVAAAADPAHAAQILCEIAEVYRDHEAAESSLASFERALSRDPSCLQAIRALQEHFEQSQLNQPLVGLLRREVRILRSTPGLADPGRLVALHTALGELGVETGASVDEALSDLTAALALDPSARGALTAAEALCRQHGRDSDLVKLLEQAPSTPENMRVLGDALHRLGRYSELVEVRRMALDLLESPDEIATASRELANIFLQELRDPATALRILDRAHTRNPRNRSLLAAMSAIYEQQAAWEPLSVTLEKELALVPRADVADRLTLLRKLASIYRTRLVQPLEAAQAWEAAIELDPTDLVSLSALDSVYAELELATERLRILEATARATPETAAQIAIWQRAAELAIEQQLPDRAIAAFRAAFDLDPSNRAQFTTLEALCYENERWAAAMSLYDFAIQLVEQKTVRAYRLTDLYARKAQLQLQFFADPEGAAKSYLRLLELDPENSATLELFASLHAEPQKRPTFAAALEQIAAAATRPARKIELLRSAGRLYVELSQQENAVRVFSDLLELSSADSEALSLLEKHYERTQGWDALLRLLQDRLAKTTDPDAAAVLHAKIALLSEEGARDGSRATEHYIRLLELEPENREALDSLARIYESTEKWNDLVEITRRQIRVTPDRAAKALLYFKCGSVMESKFDRLDEALRYYEAAVKTSPTCLPAVHGLRDLHVRENKWDKVVETLEIEVKLWQEDKERAGIYAQIGQVYRDRLGDVARAIRYFENARSVDPDCAPANKGLFELHVEREEWSEAAPLGIALSQKAMREGDPAERSRFYEKRGMVATKTGDLSGAAESLVIALEIKPDNLNAVESLRRLAAEAPQAYDYATTFRELEKIYRRRQLDSALARVLGALADLSERDGDLDGALALHREAIQIAPLDIATVEALIDFRVRRRQWADAVRELDALISAAQSTDDRVRALSRLAEIVGDYLQDFTRASALLSQASIQSPERRDLRFRLAQALLSSGRLAEAHTTIDALIEFATQPGSTAPPEALSRYYHYLGRILELENNGRPAAARYRRATELDPTYAAPVLALARRAVDAKDYRAAEQLLINAAHAAMERGGPKAAVPIQRRLAEILALSGDLAGAIQAYRGIVATIPDSSTDRIGLARCLARSKTDRSLASAETELDIAVRGDLRKYDALALFVEVANLSGDVDRSARAADLLQKIAPLHRAVTQRVARTGSVKHPRWAQLDDQLRTIFVEPEPCRTSWWEAYLAVRAELLPTLLPSVRGEHPVPLSRATVEPQTKQDLTEQLKSAAVDCAIEVAENLPELVFATESPTPILVLDRGFLAASTTQMRRFVVGRALGLIRAGGAGLLALPLSERSGVFTLVDQLLRPDSERDPAVREFAATLSRKSTKLLETLVGKESRTTLAEVEQALIVASNLAGLVAADDIASACQGLAALVGELASDTQSPYLAADEALLIALGPSGAPIGAHAMVSAYLSETYTLVRSKLALA